MAGEEHVSVAVRDDFVARQTKAKPVPALAELCGTALTEMPLRYRSSSRTTILQAGCRKSLSMIMATDSPAVMPVLCSAISAAFGRATSDRQGGITV